MEEILKNLDGAQREAVIYTEGPSLMLAGPGAGKTRALTHKVAWLIYNGIPADSILCMTFTNKAAEEMRRRVSHLVNNSIKLPWMGTFHSMFACILRREARALSSLTSLEPSFTIYDTEDAKNLLKRIFNDNKIEMKKYTYGKLYALISYFKNRGVTVNIFPNSRYAEKFNKEEVEVIHFVWSEYEKALVRANAVDFDNILLHTLKIFSNDKSVLEKYRNMFQYVLIDEFQDTNTIQYQIAKMLSEEHRRITVVGDDCQSIYGFRGASFKNIFDFKNDFPEARIFYLTNNYRSSKTIVTALNSVIKNMEVKYDKELLATINEGIPVKVVIGMDERDEARKIAETILEMKNRFRLSYNECAVLYRANYQSGVIEEALRHKNIPYRVYGGISFFQRQEIKDVLAYCRCVCNPSDDEALLRIINIPRRNIGEETLNKIIAVAKQNNCSIWDVISSDMLLGGVKMSRNTYQGIKEFRNLILKLREEVAQQDAGTLLNEIIDSTGILEYYKKSDEDRYEDRVAHIEELRNSVRGFVDEVKGRVGTPPSLIDFLGRAALLTSQDMDAENGKVADAVSLMTVHASKGLEFTMVCVVGLNQGVFPIVDPSTEDEEYREEYEEEKRLFYVAISRAKKILVLSHSEYRRKKGNKYPVPPSDFLSFIPEEVAEIPRMIERGKRVFPYHNMASNSISPGTMVFHGIFGNGIVLDCEDGKATVFFHQYGEKCLDLRYANLKILN